MNEWEINNRKQDAWIRWLQADTDKNQDLYIVAFYGPTRFHSYVNADVYSSNDVKDYKSHIPLWWYMQ